MNILITGQGAREHALAWKIAQSPQVQKIWVAPGNAGTALESKTSNIAIESTDIQKLVDFAKDKLIDLTIVGSETALAAGIVDAFQKEKLSIFGPTQIAAQLETSKVFSKEFMKRHALPTAPFQIFSDSRTALSYLQTCAFPVVIKADGLAAGKGVIIAQSFAEAEHAVLEILDQHCFGTAGQRIVIENFLSGEELSFIAMVDGKHILPLVMTQDHKKRDEQELGPNTGGMGAYTPVPQFEHLTQKIMQKIMEPTVAALRKDNIHYVGFLYAGLMITPDGEPYLLEFNVRLGDPETQVILMRMQSDLVSLIQTALQGQLDQIKIDWDLQAALTVVLAAEGYPYAYKTGDVITGLDTLPDDPRIKVFHAGTKLQANQIITNGGRVLSVTALGDNLKEAQTRAYMAAKHIHWPGCYYRRDIGDRALSCK